MRSLFLKTTVLSTAVAAGAFALLGAGRPASAQTDIPTASEQPPIVTVRGGVYFPFNSRLKANSGKTFYGGGLDYRIQGQPGVTRTELSVDYIERSSGGNTIRIIPVTVGQFALQLGQGTVHPYVGFGAGAYFVHENLPDNNDIQQNTNKVAIGGYVGAGLDLPSNLMVEARYHLIEKVGTYEPSGLQVMAGIRF